MTDGGNVFRPGGEEVDARDVDFIIIEGRDGDDLIDLRGVSGFEDEYGGHVGYFGALLANITVDEGDGDDTLFASPHAGSENYYYGGPGDDTMNGGGAADRLFGEDGDDSILGNDGDDELFGGSGADIAYGGNGNDTLDGGLQSDLLNGEAGNDTFILRASDGGTDTVVEAANVDSDTLEFISDGAGLNIGLGSTSPQFIGNTANAFVLSNALGIENVKGTDYPDYGDVIYGNARDNIIWGGDGDDGIWPGDGNDVAYGGDGNDYFYGDDGDDLYYGGNGNDDGYGMLGNDSLFGESGVDWLYGDGYDEGGDDSLDGGSGNDALFGDSGDDIMNGDDGVDTLEAGSGNDTLYGGGDTDYMYGQGGDDQIYSDDENDEYGYGGLDYSDGGVGNDYLVAGVAADTLVGGGGVDYFIGSPVGGSGWGHQIIVDFAYDTIGISFVLGTETANGTKYLTNNGQRLKPGGLDIRAVDLVFMRVYTGSGDDEIDLSSINSTDFTAFAGGVVITSGNGNDIIYGTDFGDNISAGDGNDVIYGNGGNDTISGGEGYDIAYGGAGADVDSGVDVWEQ